MRSALASAEDNFGFWILDFRLSDKNVSTNSANFIVFSDLQSKIQNRNQNRQANSKHGNLIFGSCVSWKTAFTRSPIFTFSFAVAHQPAFHDHAFVQNHVDIINRRLFFERRIARHAHQREGVYFAGAFGLDPIELAETIDAGDARKKLHLAATLAFLQQKLTARRRLPRTADRLY